jgi:hypothetical protein
MFARVTSSQRAPREALRGLTGADFIVDAPSTILTGAVLAGGEVPGNDNDVWVLFATYWRCRNERRVAIRL